MTTIRPAVVLLSGGIDSTVTLAVANSLGFAPYALSFRYGQRHAIELDAAVRVAAALSAAQHVTVDIDLGVFGGSALTDASIDVPRNETINGIDDAAPVTYVPARNTIFLSFALAYAETLGARDIFIGANAADFSGYPDCRPAYLAAFQRMANLATRESLQPGSPGLTIRAPLAECSKAQVIRRGLKLGVDFTLTHSCYDPDNGRACGGCDACLIRAAGFTELGLPDPVMTAVVG